ncbi:DUF3576 domain-containing protein [Geminicoccaceae bacterium 1502E]|nr:DUF3576 domain-containing protein [Geminicoccaceae bacterium 1502E]
MVVGKGAYRIAGALLLAGLVTACGAGFEKPEFQPDDPKVARFKRDYGSVLGGEGGVTLFGGGRSQSREEAGGGGGGIGVNAYLWRASLDTLDFMPLASADPFGGLILSDWYQPVDAQGERVKVRVMIRDTVLRADGLKVSVFRQTRNAQGEWLDAPVDPVTATDLEDQILTRARQLRIASAEAGS